MNELKKLLIIIFGGIGCAFISWMLVPCLEYWKQFRLEELGGLFFISIVVPLVGFLSFVPAWFIFKHVSRSWLRWVMAFLLGLFISGTIDWCLMSNGDFGYYTKIDVVHWWGRIKEMI